MTTQDDLRAAAERLKDPRWWAKYSDGERRIDKDIVVNAYLATLDERPVTEDVSWEVQHKSAGHEWEPFSNEQSDAEEARRYLKEYRTKYPRTEFRLVRLIVRTMPTEKIVEPD